MPMGSQDEHEPLCALFVTGLLDGAVKADMCCKRIDCSLATTTATSITLFVFCPEEEEKKKERKKKKRC